MFQRMDIELRYSPIALVRRAGWMALAAAVVLVDFVAHAGGGFPKVFGLGVVPSATLIATALYLTGVTMVLTLGLLRHGGIALSSNDSGLTINTAWSSKAIAWSDLSRISLEVRYTKTRHYTVIAAHETRGAFRCHTVDTRLLAETLDMVDLWVGTVERNRVAHGGAAYVAKTSGLAGYNARQSATTLAADVAAARTGSAV